MVTAVIAEIDARGYCSVSQAAVWLAVSRVTVWRWIRAGRLPAVRLGHRTVRIRVEDLQHLLEEVGQSGGKLRTLRLARPDPETPISHVRDGAAPALTPTSLTRKRAAATERARAAGLDLEQRAALQARLDAALSEAAEERDRAIAAERAARETVERAQRRAVFLSEASVALAASLDYESTLDRIAKLAVPAIADWCVVDLAERDDDGGARLRRITSVHADPTKQQYIQRLRVRYPMLDAGASHTAMRVLRSGRPWFDPSVSDARLAAESRDPDHLALMRALGFRAEMVVPLIARDQTLGTITLVAGDGRSYGRDDLEFAEELARRCAMAIANARAFAAEEVARRQAQRAADQTRRLQEITGQLSRSLEADQLLANVARSAADLLEAPVGAVFLLDRGEPEGDFFLVAAHGIDETLGAALRLPRHASLAGMAIDQAKTLTVDNVRRTPGTALPKLLTGRTDGSEIAAPIIAGEARLGVVKVFSPRARRFHADDAALLSALAAAASVALTNARLFREAQEAIQARETFLSIASHELRTPLTSLMGYAQMAVRRLDRNGHLEPERAELALRAVVGQADRLSRLLSQLLDISRLASGKLSLEPQITDLAALLEQCVGAARLWSDRHPIALSSPARLEARIDPLRLEQVLANLLDNAIKYSPEGGPVDVALSRSNDGWVELSIRDRGLGIAPEQRGQIFERFYQAHRASHRSGLGLGLYVSREIVEGHGGEISAEFPDDGGTRFVVRLPASASDSTGPASALDADRAPD
jgi:excisionase family DNA binding protein